MQDKCVQRGKRYAKLLLKIQRNSKKCLSFHTSQLTELYEFTIDGKLTISHKKNDNNSKLITEDILGIKPDTFADIHLNNAGSPYVKSAVWSSETKVLEIEILEMWAKYLGIEPNKIRGYVTSGSTEGNMACINWHIMYFKNSLSRLDQSKVKMLNQRKNQLELLGKDFKNYKNIKNKGLSKNFYNKYSFLANRIKILEENIRQIRSPVLYATKQPHSHYSIAKVISLYKLEAQWVNNNFDGSIDLVDFEKKIEDHAIKYSLSPVIVNINIGTTITGAIDDAPAILKILKRYSIRYSIHLDAAMLGAVLRFISPYQNVSNYLLALEAKTIVISGHKFLGTSQITGVACAERKFLSKAFPGKKHYVGYTGNLHDITISGSRSGFNIVLLHNIMSSLDMDGDYDKLKNLIKICFDNLEYLRKGLIDIIGSDNIILLPNQFNILFIRPSQRIQKKYALMPVLEDYSSIIVTAKVTPEKINSFLNDYKQDDQIITKLFTVK